MMSRPKIYNEPGLSYRANFKTDVESKIIYSISSAALKAPYYRDFKFVLIDRIQNYDSTSRFRPVHHEHL